MDRFYLLIAGVLTGAAVGMLSGHVNYWLAAGAVIGVVMSAAARRRRKQAKPQQLKADS